jgi:spermidine synthase
MTALLYFIFILSGAAGLIYESIWTRYLGLFVGHSAYAQIIVLVIFLGGMSLGAVLAGRRSDRLARPLYWYAGIEIVVGIIGLLFDDIFRAVSAGAYDSIFPSIGSPLVLTMVKWLLAAMLILPQSVLLGATFPLMSAGTLRIVSAIEGTARSGRVLAMLYFANSLGAAAGVLFAGFYLIGAAGLPGTLLAAAIINLAVGLVVLVAVRMRTMRAASRGEDSVVAALMDAPAETGDERTHARPVAGIAPAMLVRAMLIVSFGTAVASFVYEIAWIRMLSLVLGAATHSFELMLSAFILGLSLGAFWVRRRADSFTDPVRTLAIVQWLMGTFALLTLPVYVASFEWTAELMQGLARNDNGYRMYGVVRYAMCLLVMLPSTFCAGITLPLITRTLLASGSGERAIGTVYGVNTLGSIVGVSIAGLILLPLLGVKGLLIVGAVADIALGIYLLAVFIPRSEEASGTAADGIPPRAAGARRLAGVVAAVTVLVAVGTAYGAGFDKALLTSGVFRYGSITLSGRDVKFYRDGRTATVSGTQDTIRQQFTLATNGKPDASLEAFWIRPYQEGQPRRRLTSDQSTQVMLPVVTMAFAPQAKSVAVIGQGSGISTHTYLGNPSVTRVTTIEIEPEMINGSRAMFYPANSRAFDDPRSRMVIDDAKSFFAAAGEKFDIIMSEPSNPWVSGVSGLFTTEFYERVRTYLAPNGIFGQWLHLYETDDALVMSVLAAVQRNFPSYALYQVSNGDMLIVASMQEQLGEPDWGSIEHPGIREDLRRVLPVSRDYLNSMWLGSSRSLAPVLEEGTVANSDFFPILDLGTEKSRYLHTSASGFMALGDHRFSLLAPVEGRRIGFVEELVAPLEVQRAEKLAFGARLRRYARTGEMDTLPRTDQFDVARTDWETLRNSLSSGRAPSDWKIWVARAMKVEEDWHGGMAGVVDESFYAPLFDFARRMQAPPNVMNTLRLMHGIGSWNWEEAAQAAAPLVDDRRRVSEGRPDPSLAPDQQDDTQWLPASLLRDGAVMARLFTGDVKGARAAFDLLHPISAREGDRRARILDGYLRTAEGGRR